MKSTNAVCILFIVSLLLFSCSSAKKEAAGSTESESQLGYVKSITSAKQLDTILEKAGNKLVGFDLYADWCRPCRILSPTLERIAQNNSSKVIFYKINIDKLPQVASAFGVSGIPLVVFMKNKTVVRDFVGVQPEEDYISAINANFDSTGKK